MSTDPLTPPNPDDSHAQARTGPRVADSQRDATTLQPPAAETPEKPPGDDGGTRTKAGSNYGDWVPDKREPEHPAVRHPEEMPLTPPPKGTSPLQGAFERGDGDPLIK